MWPPPTPNKRWALLDWQVAPAQKRDTLTDEGPRRTPKLDQEHQTEKKSAAHKVVPCLADFQPHCAYAFKEHGDLRLSDTLAKCPMLTHAVTWG